ncbi:VOC family protein [Paenibacillus sp. DMB5]|uniref:VOC family protein n=1 Tax=Paenibacillus sp. DMB5 TaxID=1780103 RepID=UPI00076C8C65|nr:VOC family protein [Paenibacillus sp. DMB5]KUP25914.1 channel protein [Paenibacillus sp. DMB5]
MEFKSIMHVSFFTDQMEVVRDFYENKLGLKPKMIVRFGAYKGSNNPMFSKKAETHPDDICIIYFEIAPGQFIEFFPKMGDQGPHGKWNQNLGYTHFGLLVDDIFKTKEELLAAGISLDNDISKGPSETYQMWVHDPDGNKIEIMQYTENSMQLKGNY